jgi:hypothetical protein
LHVLVQLYVLCPLLSAAAVLEQLSFKAAMQHKATVAKVATGLAAKGRSQLLGVLFDELARCGIFQFVLMLGMRIGVFDARKHWESESGKMGDHFDVESMIGSGAGSSYEMLVGEAKDLWDALLAPKVGWFGM